MYFVIIDLAQLNTRLCNCESARQSTTLSDWLDRNGFRPNGDGWMADDDALRCLSCSEILSCEDAAAKTMAMSA